MNSFLSREVYIRIADDQAALVCTVKRGILFSRTTVFPLVPERATGDGNPLTLAKKRPGQGSASVSGQNPLGLEDEQAANQ